MTKTTTDRIKLDVNMKDNPANVTWTSHIDVLTIKLLNSDVELQLELGEDVIRQLRQALSWQALSPTENRKLYT